LPNNGLWACPAPNYGSSLFSAGRFVRFSAKFFACWRLHLPSGKHAIRLIYYQTMVNKKMTKKEFFFGHFREGGDPENTPCKA